MAVGKGSVERAAKAASAKTASVKSAAKAAVKEGAAAKGNAAAEKTAAKATAVKAAETVTVPDKEVLERIVYQTSSGMLERGAQPNEIFGLGDAMPVYYF